MIGPSRCYPEELTQALREVLGFTDWQIGRMAVTLRAAGHELPSKAADEQAHVLHLLIGFAVEDGEKWMESALRYIDALIEDKKRQTAEGPGEGPGSSTGEVH